MFAAFNHKMCNSLLQGFSNRHSYISHKIILIALGIIIQYIIHIIQYIIHIYNTII